MAVDMFLKIDGIKGEAQDAKHKGDIDVLAWSWGATQSATTHMGGGGGSGKASFQDMHITKYVDSATHNLLKHTSTGKHIKEALLTVRKAGETPLEYIKIKMTDCLISSISTGGSGGEDRLTENISLNFAEYEFVYTPQKADGSGDSALPFKFNIATNEVK
ncbi:MAG: type VI secretion system tube protein Hcp [Deltaproteobacteria bacterium]|jgi:type VI secretion system secreted protein Hcp|nr:type VI secretion system tube protein Hcp [Deltaproteobacteria bacterium]